MKAKISFYSMCFFLTLSVFKVTGQGSSNPGKVRLFTITEASFSHGYHTANHDGFTISQFRRLVGTAPIFDEIPADLDRNYPYLIFSRQPYTYSASLGFRFTEPQSGSTFKAPLFRLGLSFSTDNWLYGSSGKTNVWLIDSTSHPVTGEISYIDSLHKRDLSLFAKSNQISLDASMVFTSKRYAIFSFYGGVGMQVGIPVMSLAAFTYTESHHRVGRTPDGTPTFLQSEYLPDMNQTFTCQPTLVLTPYVPFGIDMRLSNNHPLLSQVSLFSEFRIGFNVRMVPGEKNIQQMTRQQTFGLRVRWNQD